MQTIETFTANVIALSMCVALAEYAIPAGTLKNTVSVAVGLVFLSALADQILVIFAHWGV